MVATLDPAKVESNYVPKSKSDSLPIKNASVVQTNQNVFYTYIQIYTNL